MISAINNYHTNRNDAVTTPPASTTSDSAGFGTELQSQLSLPDILQVFEGSSGSGSSPAPAAAATPAAQPVGATDVSTTTSVPTAQSVFGDQPWMTDPQGNAADGTTWDYNPVYFATESTADQVAAMVGGKVIQQEAITSAGGSTLQQTSLNYMVQLPGGSVINPGLVADFYDHGYSQTTVDQMIANEVQGV